RAPACAKTASRAADSIGPPASSVREREPGKSAPQPTPASRSQLGAGSVAPLPDSLVLCNERVGKQLHKTGKRARLHKAPPARPRAAFLAPLRGHQATAIPVQ